MLPRTRLRAIGATLLLLLWFTTVPLAAEEIHEENEPVTFFVSAGLGMPELFHAEVGYFVTERFALEIRGGLPLFNFLVGIGATGYFFGSSALNRPPRHALLLSGEARVQPFLRPFRLRAEADLLPAAAGVYLGYGFLSDRGFYFRVLLGSLLYLERGLSGGPNGTFSVGYAF